jgi:hypothetical protein
MNGGLAWQKPWCTMGIWADIHILESPSADVRVIVKSASSPGFDTFNLHIFATFVLEIIPAKSLTLVESCLPQRRVGPTLGRNKA